MSSRGDSTHTSPEPDEKNNLNVSGDNNIYIFGLDPASDIAATGGSKKIITSTQMKDLFKSTNSGKSILEVYDKSHFTRVHRQMISDIIIRNELEGKPDRRIGGERMQELANMIAELFPSEYKVPTL